MTHWVQKAASRRCPPSIRTARILPRRDQGWYPETPFEVGIVKTIDWYLENEERMKRVTSGDYQKYYETMYKNRQ